MTDTTARTDRRAATDEAAEVTAEQTADAEMSAEARTSEASTAAATTVDERDRSAAQPAGGAATTPLAAAAPGQSAPGSTHGQPTPPPAATSSGGETALFDDTSTKDFQGRWQTIQVGFVDEPRAAVEQADRLVEEVLAKLQDSFGRERQELERAWSGGGESSTEDLRQAIRRYRSFFNRLLSI